MQRETGWDRRHMPFQSWRRTQQLGPEQAARAALTSRGLTGRRATLKSPYTTAQERP